MKQKTKDQVIAFLCGILPSLLLQEDEQWVRYSFQVIDVSILPIPQVLQKKLFDFGVFKIYDLFASLPFGIDSDIDDLKECVLVAYAKLMQYL